MAKLLSKWREAARFVIARTLFNLPPGASDPEIRRALRDAYPFGKREHHPYKCWLKEVRDYFGGRPGICETPVSAPPAVLMLVDGVHCGWCESRCLLCVNERTRYAGIDWQGWPEQLSANPDDPDLRRVLADWLEERGMADMAGHYREEAKRLEEPCDTPSSLP